MCDTFYDVANLSCNVCENDFKQLHRTENISCYRNVCYGKETKKYSRKMPNNFSLENIENMSHRQISLRHQLKRKYIFKIFKKSLLILVFKKSLLITSKGFINHVDIINQ